MPHEPRRWRPHPWHGLSAGREPPLCLDVYVEITQADALKFEVDRESGYLRVARPQSTSALPPAAYGFVPRTLAGPRVAALTPGAHRGDGDPLDAFVLSERFVTRVEVLLPVRVVGGIRTLDQGRADDKLVAVLEDDALWGAARDIADVAPGLIDRLRHYLATYKLEVHGHHGAGPPLDLGAPHRAPGVTADVTVLDVYDAAHAARVVRAALADHAEAFPDAAFPDAALHDGAPRDAALRDGALPEDVHADTADRQPPRTSR